MQKAIQEYEAFVQEVWGPTGRASQENERTTREIVEYVYADVDEKLWDAAEWSVQAQLDYLRSR